MCFISRRPLTDRVIKVMQHRNGLYEFYDRLVTVLEAFENSIMCWLFTSD